MQCGGQVNGLRKLLRAELEKYVSDPPLKLCYTASGLNFSLASVV